METKNFETMKAQESNVVLDKIVAAISSEASSASHNEGWHTDAWKTWER